MLTTKEELARILFRMDFFSTVWLWDRRLIRAAFGEAMGGLTQIFCCLSLSFDSSGTRLSEAFITLSGISGVGALSATDCSVVVRDRDRSSLCIGGEMSQTFSSLVASSCCLGLPGVLELRKGLLVGLLSLPLP